MVQIDLAVFACLRRPRREVTLTSTRPVSITNISDPGSPRENIVSPFA